MPFVFILLTSLQLMSCGKKETDPNAEALRIQRHLFSHISNSPCCLKKVAGPGPGRKKLVYFSLSDDKRSSYFNYRQAGQARRLLIHDLNQLTPGSYKVEDLGDQTNVFSSAHTYPARTSRIVQSDGARIRVSYFRTTQLRFLVNLSSGIGSLSYTHHNHVEPDNPYQIKPKEGPFEFYQVQCSGPKDVQDLCKNMP